MCDYSLHTVAFRPARVGETLVSTGFHGTSTRGFAAKGEPNVAVCLLPGTELAFERDVRYNRKLTKPIGSRLILAKIRTGEQNDKVRVVRSA